MTTSVSALGRRAVAVAGVAAVGLLGLSPLAVADEQPNFGNIKENATGSLTIHKHIQGDGTAGAVDGTGNEGNQPVAGVQFTAYPITDIDLKTTDGWKKVTALAEGVIPDSACQGTPALTGYTVDANGLTSGDTDAQGQASISALPVKAYLVCETKAPSDIVQKAKPFVVTIPHPNTTDGSASKGQWLYDVHAYPKNVKLTINKTIEDQKKGGYTMGSTITFPVTSALPTLDSNAHYKYYRVQDTLDTRLTESKVTKVTVGDTELGAGDYRVEVNGQIVNVDFTKAGLAKLKDGAGKDLTVTFQGTVTAAGDGTIKNTATVIADTVYAPTAPDPENPPANPESPPTSPPVETKWGDLKITKVDGNETGANKATLKGAEFQIYNADDPYAADCSTTSKTGDPLTVGGQQTLTTNDQGEIDIKALFISDSVATAGRDNSVGADKRCYVLVETKAPTGYTLPANAVTPVTVRVGAVTDDNVTIENTKHSVPQLPLTGAAGKVLLIAAGAALLMVAVGSALVSRRRQQKNSEPPRV